MLERDVFLIRLDVIERCRFKFRTLLKRDQTSILEQFENATVIGNVA